VPSNTPFIISPGNVLYYNDRDVPRTPEAGKSSFGILLDDLDILNKKWSDLLE